MKYNNEFKIIDTFLKAYILGLFYADGNVSSNQNHSRIQLKENDGYLLKDIQKSFPFFRIYEGKKYDLNKVTLYSGYKQFKEDLISNGCLPRKSKSNKRKLKFPRISDEYMSDFIRGYYDGDGGCTLSYSNNKVQKRIYIYSASVPFLNDMQKWLSYYSVSCSVKYSSNITYKLTIKTKSYQLFYSLLYSKTNLYMVRKKETFDKILKHKIFIQKQAPECKHCHSLNTVWNGNDYYKGVKRPRVWCKRCNRNFICPS
jgi:hypothetical protein